MSLKKKLGLGMASAALGLSLIGGGTYALFTDTEQATASFAAGTVDLQLNKSVWFDIDKLAPGDAMIRTLEIKNIGSLDIKKVLMGTDYEVTAGGNDHLSADDFAKQFKVEFLKSDLKTVVTSKTLYELKNMAPLTVSNWSLLEDGLNPNELTVDKSDTLWMRIIFVDDGSDQNRFQGDALKVKFNFEAIQRDGNPLR